MSWLIAHLRFWRTLGLIVLLVAIGGPWFFDRINVPLPYVCSLPNIRLDENFCGLPISLARFLPIIVVDFASLAFRLVTGGFRPGELYAFFGLLLLVLPVLSSLLLIWRGDRPRWQIVHLLALGLAALVSVWIGFQQNFSHPLAALWGLWLYIGVTVCMLLCEALLLISARRPAPD